MPDHIRGAQADRERTNNPSKSHLASMIRWLQIKKYQYEVTFSLYMLTPTEKIVFSTLSPRPKSRLPQPPHRSSQEY